MMVTLLRTVLTVVIASVDSEHNESATILDNAVDIMTLEAESDEDSTQKKRARFGSVSDGGQPEGSGGSKSTPADDTGVFLEFT